MRTGERLYKEPRVRMITIHAECSGIGIGSGNTTPEDCESNASVFEEDRTIRPQSVWDS